MSRDTMSTLFAVLAAAALAACAHQQPKTAAAPQPKAAVAAAPAPAAAAPAAAPVAAAAPAPVVAPEGDKRHVRGRVTAVDASAGTLAIKDGAGRSHDYRIATAAKLTKGSDQTPIALSDIKVGDRVTVWHIKDVAVSVHLRVASGGQVATNQ